MNETAFTWMRLTLALAMYWFGVAAFALFGSWGALPTLAGLLLMVREIRYGKSARFETLLASLFLAYTGIVVLLASWLIGWFEG